MNTVTLTSKGQLTISRPLRDALGLAPGTKLQVSSDHQNPQQTPLAEQVFLKAIATGGVYFPDVVLAEVTWVTKGPRQTTSSLHCIYLGRREDD